MNIRATLIGIAALVFVMTAQAQVQGVSGANFDLHVSATYIFGPDGTPLLIWGYGVDGGPPQYPGPTLIVNEGDTVTVTLTNNVGKNVSMLFPGQAGVVASGGVAGALTREVAPGPGSVEYTFVASNPGTFTYHSGTDVDLQREMGLVGALIVRPALGDSYAYNDIATEFDREYLLLLSEMSADVHNQVAFGGYDDVDMSQNKTVLWYINGRNGPDTFLGNVDTTPWMPYQPYGAMVHMEPGETVLMRVIGGGRELHPLHTHGNNFVVIGRDGQQLVDDSGTGLGWSDFTLQTTPGAAYDALFTWTGADLGWDIYGHEPDVFGVLPPLELGEDPDDHGKPFPVDLPSLQDLTLGGFYSGSAFLGQEEVLPPGEGGLNLTGGYYFMWHSHTEKELVNNDVFPGGMMTMLVVHPPGTLDADDKPILE